MKITRSNYEGFFLDYHEGNLSESLKKELLLFLENNPDLKNEFENFDLISISVPENIFFDKDRLKKNVVTLHNYKSFFVAYVEGDLNRSEKAEVDSFIQKNPFLKNEFEIFKQVKIFPDHDIVFENKRQLKQSAKIIVLTPQFYGRAIAATIALLILSYFIFRNNKEQHLAHKDTPESGTKQNISTLSNHSNNIILNRKPEDDKKPEKKIGTGIEKYRREPKDPSKNEKSTPLKDTQIKEPLLTHENEKQSPIPEVQQAHDNKDSSPENSIVENKMNLQKPFEPPPSQLSDVFSEEDLKELGISSGNLPEKKKTLWDIASRGAQQLGKVTGSEISLNKQHDELENTNSYSLAIGNFSISHTISK